MVFRNIILVPFMWCKLCYYASHVEKYAEQKRYDMLRFIVFRANKGGNVHIDVHGEENIPKENGFMFYPNHQGMYDVLAIVEAFCCGKKRSGKHPVFKTGICLHESIFN